MTFADKCDEGSNLARRVSGSLSYPHVWHAIVHHCIATCFAALALSGSEFLGLCPSASAWFGACPVHAIRVEDPSKMKAFPVESSQKGYTGNMLVAVGW